VVKPVSLLHHREATPHTERELLVIKMRLKKALYIFKGLLLEPSFFVQALDTFY